MAYYFFKRQKSLAAMAFAQQALEAYEKSDNVEAIAACLLHVAAGYSQQGEHKEAHKKLFEFLAMAEGGRLAASSDASPKQLCLVVSQIAFVFRFCFCFSIFFLFLLLCFDLWVYV
jgi:hypothetical protein